MKIFALLLCCTMALADDPQGDALSPRINLPAGAFKGSTMTSRLGRKILAFRGIRYGAEPSGENLFKEASVPAPHSGVFDATKPGPVCALPYGVAAEVSYDCLRLNVYTPELPPNSIHTVSRADAQAFNKKPVIVFLHPAGTYSDAFSLSHQLGPQYALDEDVVLVTLNYRVGSLGFLSTGDARAPGNAGLKDQVLALRWVRDNIESFGGNPNLVTLAGQNIGAQSVSLHMVSPLSRGLFHRAVAISGASPIYNTLPENHRSLALKQAELLGCPNDSVDNAITCLYGKTAKEFSDTYESLAEFYGHPVVFLPVIEQSGNAGQAFLTENPETVISENRANFVPYYTGLAKDELGFLAIRAEEQALEGDNHLYDEMNQNWAQFAPKHFNYERDSAKSKRISASLKRIYFGDKPLGQGKYQGLAQLYSDLLAAYPVSRFARLLARHSTQAVYYYSFEYESCDTYKKWSNGVRFGVTHYDPLFLLFKVEGRPALCQQDTDRVKGLWDLISNFAESGNPTPIGQYDVIWQPMSNGQTRYLEYKGTATQMVQGDINQSRMNSLDEIFQAPAKMI